MENCVFPEDVMVSILTRLPVKSILRFKSVCKPFCKLFEKPWFVKLHHAQISNNPENDSVVIYSHSDEDEDHTISLFKTESDEKIPISLDRPYPEIIRRMIFVGSCNGLVCMGCSPLGECIVLWNPAMNLFKEVRHSKVPGQMVSLGFGYDDEADDFKVVRIVHLKNKGSKLGYKVGVEVYSSISDSWSWMKLGFHFIVRPTRNDAIVNGNPYWVAMAEVKVKDRKYVGKLLLCFDVKKMMFRVFPLSRLITVGQAEVLLVDWKGSLGALVCGKKGEERLESLDVWVLDDGIWGKKHTIGFGPIDLKVDKVLQCSKNGKILGECLDGKLFLYDPETGLVKKIVIDGARKRSFVVECYAESLACIKGMEKVVVKTEEGSDGDEDEFDGLMLETDDFDWAALISSLI